MPKRVRVALLIFCIVGVLALTVDGVLLALSIMRHHSQALATSSSHVILPQVQSERKSATRTPVTASASPPIAPTFTSSPPDGSFALSSTHLNFSLSQGESNPAPQTVILSAGGHSAFSWLLVPSSSFPTWLSLSAAQGTTSAGADGRVVVNVQATRLTIGTYTAQFLVQAFNSKGHGLPGSPRTLDITLNVMIPCSLIVVPTKLSFESVLLSNPAPQSLSLREKGGCAFPITWQASSTANWVKFSHASLSDNGSGSALLVSVNISGKLVGSYTAQVTLQATDANGLPVPSSPLMITVTLTVVLN